MKMIDKVLYNYLSPAIFSYGKRLFSKSGRKSPAGQKVLIIIDGNLGDALLSVQSVRAICDFCAKEGKTPYILCASVMKRIYKSVEGLESLEILDGGEFLDPLRPPKERFALFKKTVKALNEAGDFCFTAAIDNRAPWVIFAASAVKSRRRALLTFRDTLPTRLNRKLPYILFCPLFDEVMTGVSDIHQTLSLKEFVNRLGVPQETVEITRFQEKNYDPPSENYITVAVDAATRVRCYPVERYKEIIKRLTELYDFDIVLTGSAVPDDIMGEYDALISQCPRIINMVGRTSFDEFVELLRKSRLHLCTDSGSLHIAVSVGTKTVCICGVWDRYRFLPYPPELKSEGVPLPVCVYRKDTDLNTLPCINCATRGGYGWGSSECFARCNAGKPCVCLEKVTVEDVLLGVEGALKAEEVV